MNLSVPVRRRLQQLHESALIFTSAASTTMGSSSPVTTTTTATTTTTTSSLVKSSQQKHKSQQQLQKEQKDLEELKQKKMPINVLQETVLSPFLQQDQQQLFPVVPLFSLSSSSSSSSSPCQREETEDLHSSPSSSFTFRFPHVIPRVDQQGASTRHHVKVRGSRVFRHWLSGNEQMTFSANSSQVSFQGLSVPLPFSISHVVQYQQKQQQKQRQEEEEEEEESEKKPLEEVTSSSHQFWERRFRKSFSHHHLSSDFIFSCKRDSEKSSATTRTTRRKGEKKKKRPFFTSFALSTSSRVSLPETLPALWWFYCWIHRNDAGIKWALDLKRLSKSFHHRQQQQQETERRDNHHHENSELESLVLLTSILTTRGVREADMRGQQQAEEKEEVAKSKEKRKRQKKHSNKKKNDEDVSAPTSSSSQLLTRPTGKVLNYNQLVLLRDPPPLSARDYLLSRLERHFATTMKPVGMRLLLRQFRIFLHYLDIAAVNERQAMISSKKRKRRRTSASSSSSSSCCSSSNLLSEGEQNTLSHCHKSNLVHSSVSLPKDVFQAEFELWKEWRLVYAYFPLLALRLAVVVLMNGNKNSERQEKQSKKRQQREEGESVVSISPSFAFRVYESTDHSLERIAESNSLTSTSTPTTRTSSSSSSSSQITLFTSKERGVNQKGKKKKKKKKNSRTKQQQLLLLPSSSSSSSSSSPFSNVEIEQLQTRSGYWIFRTALPALLSSSCSSSYASSPTSISSAVSYKFSSTKTKAAPPTIPSFAYFSISKLTAASLWDKFSGPKKTLFDAVPLKRRSEERRSEPFYAFLRESVAKAASENKLQKRRSSKNNNKTNKKKIKNQEEQQDGEEEELSIGQVCARARKEWKAMTPYQQSRYFDLEAIQSTFPAFEGFKQEDLDEVKRMLELERQEEESGGNAAGGNSDLFAHLLLRHPAGSS